MRALCASTMIVIQIPSSGAAIVVLVDNTSEATANTQTAIVLDCIIAGIDEPILQGVQVDGCLEGNCSIQAPSGQAYALIQLSDAATQEQIAACQNVLDGRAPSQ